MKTIYKADFSQNDVEVLDHHIAFQSHFRIEQYQIKHRLFSGGWSQPLKREVFERGHAVGALLFDPLLNKIVLIEQFRIGAYQQTEHPWLLELVAGISHKNESPRAVVERETKEEAGLDILDVIPIYEYWVSPGGTTEKISLFCARVDAQQAGGIHGLAEEGEDIRVWVFDVSEVYALLAAGKINNAMSIIAIQWFQLNEQKVREKFNT